MRERILKYEKSYQNETVAADLNNMLPGMFIEQIAAIFLENINVFVMGFISTAAIAGVGQINTVNGVLMNIFQAFAIGGTVIVGQHAGAKRNRNGAEAAYAALLLGCAVSVLLTAAIFLLREQIVLLLFGEADEEVIENSMAYFKFTALSPPLWFLYFQCCGFMRSAGDTRRPMFISIILNVASMIMNLVFSLGLHMGVTGAALSYLFSVAIAAALALAMVMRKGFSMRPRRIAGVSAAVTIRQISAIGFPSSAENLMFNGSKIIIQVFLAGMGQAMISANSIFNSVNGIFNVPVMALYALTVPVVSRCAGGAGTKGSRKVRNALDYISRRCVVWSVPVTFAHLCLGIPGALLFTRDWNVVCITAGMLAIYGVVVLIQNGSYILPNGFKAVGDARFAMVVSSVTAWAVRVFGTWFLGIYLGWGAYAVAVTQALDIALRAVIYQRRFKSGTWLRYMFEREEKIAC